MGQRHVFYGLYVGPAKLHCGATHPSVMVLLMLISNPGKTMLSGRYVSVQMANGYKTNLNEVKAFGKLAGKTIIEHLYVPFSKSQNVSTSQLLSNCPQIISCSASILAQH